MVAQILEQYMSIQDFASPGILAVNGASEPTRVKIRQFKSRARALYRLLVEP